MSYAASASLQQALYQALSAAPALAAVPIYDTQPSGARAETFVLLGPEEVADQSDASGAGAEHRVQISIISEAAGFLAVKQVASAVGDVVSGASLTLNSGRVVSIRFLRASAKRVRAGNLRRIDLMFRVRIDL